ncbi:unnamed protein product [Gongylonema pulchrum]|uniref:Secreted protein n=1 Tax=Gongylonema pulchrum TaxID=637853 RepID=A0A183DGS4_9BILA|nr:unnamed protein product [Gongylonema pulchrum]
MILILFSMFCLLVAAQRDPPGYTLTPLKPWKPENPTRSGGWSKGGTKGPRAPPSSGGSSSGETKGSRSPLGSSGSRGIKKGRL